MTKIIYGSNTGNTEEAAMLIRKHLDENIDVIDVTKAYREDFEEADKLILGSSTWGEGDLQDDWEGFLPTLEGLDMHGKTVALFGLGDQEEYPENFVDAMGILCEKMKEAGAQIVGFTETEGYDFDESRAVNEEGKFCGLALDMDNQEDLTEERIAAWTAAIKDKIL